VVLFCGKSRETLFVDKSPEWIKSCYQDINPEIKLQALNEIWFVEISLSYIVLPLNNPITVPGQEDSFPLALRLRLYDESLCSLIIELLLEVF